VIVVCASESKSKSSSSMQEAKDEIKTAKTKNFNNFFIALHIKL
jgi:hypothetical protein